MNKLALVNNFEMTKKFLNAKFDCTLKSGNIFIRIIIMSIHEKVQAERAKTPKTINEHALLLGTYVGVQSNLALRNFLVIAKLFTNANLFTIY